ncbi:CRISPR-associated endonuclease Cas2 [Methanolapillus ohkumae]|uniref:CRISPR-associated endoribonuclease Cas2 n=1 Tax=Methanolapillus ohkumae TaxID=3028298 RepID=A0AA96ZWT9_9EURY|nr:CRISPR-associated endoribonuclease Cas2 [Methanosarcinaceae archaeon Am2]
MYVIVVYDVNVEFVNKVRIFLKQYLNWVQNSVFEGELTEAEYNKIMSHLEKIIKKSNGHILCYIVRDKKYLKIDEIGTPKSEITNFL